MMLENILAHKEQEIARAISTNAIARLMEEIRSAPAPRDMLASLRQSTHKPALLAEIKQASPSRGVLKEAATFDPAALAVAYTEAGAAALSVLTDHRFFGGSLDHLTQAREASPLPVLCKDFFIHPHQVYAARAAGADAILLIARVLAPARLTALYHLALNLGMAVLVEVHRPEEVGPVLDLNPALVGINNRDLNSFHTDLSTTARLRPLIPPGPLVVSASGVSTGEHVRYLTAQGVDALLVGEALSTCTNPVQQVQRLYGKDKEECLDGQSQNLD